MNLDNNYEPMTIYQVEDVCSALETRNRLAQLYPEGLSRHGVKYLTDCTVLFDHVGAPMDVAPFSHMIESVFELVRQKEFPNRPSRMQSIYAWVNIEDAVEFSGGQVPTYEVEPDHAFIADQTYLTLGACVAGSYELARKYWEGEQSNNPKLEALIPLPVVVGKAI
ncbi:DUF2441 domain-containing protein [Vibrio sp. J383]|uniref:DUF2441 domain-containing protein n=1 Tax=Vibrio sp. J383 TaxID=2942997 RepID=UPI0020BE4377|nr:DUF2441 domain-containing protein [Vibrio sp. J383]UQV22745.1 DUF2441 domain-containing protein [Vibrio sp. J383]